MVSEHMDSTHNHRRSQWLIGAMILAILGLLLTTYSSWHHLQVKQSGMTDAVCNISQTINCDDIALSPYSEINGIPVAVLGFGYFLAMATLVGIGLRKSEKANDHLHGYVAMVIIGVLVSLAMGGISVFKLGIYCITCIGIYVITVLQAILLAVYRREIPGGFSLKSMFSGGLTAAIEVAVIVILYNLVISNMAKPSPHVKLDLPQRSGNSSASYLSSATQDIPLSKSAYSGLGEDYRKGPDDAKVVITEFADFQCPACRYMSNLLDQLYTEFNGQVQVVFRNYPLDSNCNSSIQSRMHPSACNAAILARCAGQFGKFWEFHDTVFQNQGGISDANLKVWAKGTGLSDQQIQSCLDSQDILAKVREDVRVGNSIGVDATPTVFINGKKFIGNGAEDLRQAIEQQLN